MLITRKLYKNETKTAKLIADTTILLLYQYKYYFYCRQVLYSLKKNVVTALCVSLMTTLV